MPLRSLAKVVIHLVLALSLATPTLAFPRLASASTHTSATAVDHGGECHERTDPSAAKTKPAGRYDGGDHSRDRAAGHHGDCCSGGACDMAACLHMAWLPHAITLASLPPAHMTFAGKPAPSVSRYSERLLRPPIG